MLQNSSAQHQRNITYLKDYKPCDFKTNKVNITFDLYDDHCIVDTELHFTKSSKHGLPLILDGQDLELLNLTLDHQKIDYVLLAEGIQIHDVPDTFTLQIKTRIYPHKNFELKGLYQSNQIFCTQCEAEGFRKITYYLDRPDNLSIFTVKIVAEQQKYPVLLSNGNLTEKGKTNEGRHYAIWHDPFPKPCYLFALVAGDLDHIQDQFTTCSGRNVDLYIYVEKGEQDKALYAMDALKRSMKWDEDVYGCEYDLHIFNIVAVSDFNMGAMENKSLNIFNSKYILAQPHTATDEDYEGIESVVAHEYFHNWTGNRVTCRDWFQLSLKEGLTVFRDHEFSADMGSRGVTRIKNVKRLKHSQFVEDASPMAHPIRPDHYIEIDNFYTPTIYEKGSEVIRMMHTILGAQNFRKGCDLYFQRHDGQAVTCEDFVKAMQDASGIDLTYFQKWYHQAGTPHLTVTSSYDQQKEIYQLHFSQETKPTPGQAIKHALTIPVKLALFSQKDGSLIPKSEQLFLLEQKEATLTFNNIKEEPVVSLLRDLSAPVILHSDEIKDPQKMSILAQHDTDDFNRWQAAQIIYEEAIRNLMKNNQINLQTVFDLVNSILEDQTCDPAMKAEILRLPAETLLHLSQSPIQIDETHEAVTYLRTQIAHQFEAQFEKLYHSLNTSSNKTDLNRKEADKRSLKNLCLAYLARTQSQKALELCEIQINQHPLMTDIIAGLASLSHIEDKARYERVFSDFYQRFKHDPLIVNKWLMIQATSSRTDVLTRVKALSQHDGFTNKNPNKVYALLLAFASSNPSHFHSISGEGYEFIANQVIEINQFNPQPAARLVQSLTRHKNYDPARGALMKKELEKILASPDLSKDVYEIVSKSLA